MDDIIKPVQDSKRELEKEMLYLITQFQNNTGTIVTGIQPYYVAGGTSNTNDRLVKIELTVEIPK